MHRKYLRMPSIYLPKKKKKNTAAAGFQVYNDGMMVLRDLEFLGCPNLEDGEAPNSTSSANAN